MASPPLDLLPRAAVGDLAGRSAAALRRWGRGLSWRQTGRFWGGGGGGPVVRCCLYVLPKCEGWVGRGFVPGRAPAVWVAFQSQPGRLRAVGCPPPRRPSGTAHKGFRQSPLTGAAVRGLPRRCGVCCCRFGWLLWAQPKRPLWVTASHRQAFPSEAPTREFGRSAILAYLPEALTDPACLAGRP